MGRKVEGAGRVPILMYHSIASEASRKFRPFAVAPAVFADQMAYLAQNGYTPLTISALVRAWAGGGAGLPARPIVLTFDDGFADFHTHALPVLYRYGFTATLYVTTGYIGGTSLWLDRDGEGERRMLTWPQLAEVSVSGVECGGHTHTHPPLDAIAPAAARDEIERCRAILEQGLGQRVISFAYPYGYYNPAVRGIVQDAGYTSACAVKYALSSPADDRFALARYIVTADMNLEDFATLLAGNATLLDQLLLRTRSQVWHFLRRSAAPLLSRPGERMST